MLLLDEPPNFCSSHELRYIFKVIKQVLKRFGRPAGLETDSFTCTNTHVDLETLAWSSSNNSFTLFSLCLHGRFVGDSVGQGGTRPERRTGDSAWGFCRGAGPSPLSLLTRRGGQGRGALNVKASVIDFK